LAEIFINVSSEKTDLEAQGETLKTLTERLQKTKAGIAGGLEDYEVHRPHLAEWIYLLQRFNKGRSPGDMPEPLSRSTQLADSEGSTSRNETQGDDPTEQDSEAGADQEDESEGAGLDGYEESGENEEVERSQEVSNND
jgi:hypothetical protein